MATSKLDQALESNRNLSRTILTNTVSAVHRGGWTRRDDGLYPSGGERKYLNREERARVLAALEKLDAERALFCLVLAWTGARVSEVLSLTPQSFQFDTSVVSILTLKRRKFVMRGVPIPPNVMARLDCFFGLRRAQQ